MSLNFRTLDFKALSIFRICLGLSWLWTLLVHTTDLQAHYSDFGVLPREVVRLIFPHESFSSFIFISGEVGFAWFIFATAIALAVLFTLGVGGTLITAANWFFCIAIQSRNEFVLNGADHYMRILFFFAMFLPLFKHWSVQKRNSEHLHRHFGLFYCVQIIVLYVSTFAAKFKSEEWRNGSALYGNLDFDILTRAYSQKLLQYPAFLEVLNYVIFYFELLIPFLLLASLLIKNRTAVNALIASVITMHIGIMIVLKLYLIPTLSIISLIPFLQVNALEPVKAAVISKITKYAYSFLASAVLLILYWNLTVIAPAQFQRPLWLQKAFYSLRLDQDWSFYAPPFQRGYDEWYAMSGTTTDGNTVDVWNLKASAPSEEKPIHLSNYYPNQHWTAYFMNVWWSDKGLTHESLAKYLCRRWNYSNANNPVSDVQIKMFYSTAEAQSLLFKELKVNCSVQ